MVSSIISSETSTSAILSSEVSSDILSEIPSESSEEISSSTPSSSEENSVISAYYASVDLNLTGTALKNALNARLRQGFSGITYSRVWDAAKAGDQDPNNANNVLDIYGRKSFAKTAQDTGSSGDVWNREHVFPQAKLQGNTSTISDVTDAFNLFASDKKINELRGNKMFSNVSGGTQAVNNVGAKTDNFYTSSHFEPTDAAKGEVARATMYMAVMYKDYLNIQNNGVVADLLAWNLAFPPQEGRELQKVEVVYGMQYNRNPFIDHPELACKIWSGYDSASTAVCQ